MLRQLRSGLFGLPAPGSEGAPVLFSLGSSRVSSLTTYKSGRESLRLLRKERELHAPPGECGTVAFFEQSKLLS